MNTTKNAPRFINDTQVQVTKEFAKNARIFGTAEYKLWKEIRLDCPNAEMVTKSITLWLTMVKENGLLWQFEYSARD